jgi:hypothetical protein
MKTFAKLLVLLGMAALVSGCGPEERTRDLPGAPPAMFELRMLGVGQGDLSSALISVSSVTASARGAPLEVEPVLDTVELTQPDQAWLLGRVRVPEGVERVDFDVRFDDAGGYESKLQSGAVASRRAEIAWSAPVTWLRTHGHAVIHLDLERSLVATGAADSRRLIPAASIHY